MGTTIRPELSAKNPYWIEKHRYYELKHFCLQYPSWRKAYVTVDGLSKMPEDLLVLRKRRSGGDPTAKCVEAREYYLERMRLIERIAVSTDSSLSDYILKGVTEGLSYDVMLARYGIPCCKETYYDRYRKFFYLLSQERK